MQTSILSKSVYRLVVFTNSLFLYKKYTVNSILSSAYTNINHVN